MPARHTMMPAIHHPAAHRRHGAATAGVALAAASALSAHARSVEEEELWEGPTLKELVERVEHQFGQTPALAGVFTLGFGRDEPLTPGDIQAVCDHLGLPAEDFGLDP